ncbi:MAG: phosphodiester glycosidase family protein [Armatimonadetes bacterium]|nr:phosphodiester glycosidase family protein [Armatimonadota bacterium]
MGHDTAKALRHGGAQHAAPLLLCVALLPAGCARHAVSAEARASSALDGAAGAETLAAGVVHRAIPTGDGAGVDIVDVDLTRGAAHPVIVTGKVRGGSGLAYTPQEWLTRTHALAAVNGGYFGQEDEAGRKEFIGLLVRKGRVMHPAPPLTGQGSATLAPGRYVRSVFGLTRGGAPAIAWAATAPALVAYDAPLIRHRRPRPWPVTDAIGCGPTLIQRGRVVVTDRLERLASPGPLPRTFVAYDGPAGHPAHFVLGVASSTTYPDLASFLRDYFSRYDGTQVEAAMCLDGGASTQFSYRQGNAVQSPRFTGVTVPDAVVLLPR